MKTAHQKVTQKTARKKTARSRSSDSRHTRPPYILVFSAMDGSGGAGTLADSRAIINNGGHPLLIQTALTAQNLDGVLSCWHTSPTHIRRQFAALQSATISAIKIGVSNAATANIIAQCVRALSTKASPPLVWDPVISPTIGKAFVGNNEIAKCIRHIAPLATVITPNYDECIKLATVFNPKEMRNSKNDLQTAITILLKSGVQCILSTDIKQGAQVHLNMYRLANNSNNQPVITWQDKCHRRAGNFHGTGCFMSSVLTTRLALGDSPEVAAAYAHRQTLKAIDKATHHPQLGKQWLLG